MIYDSKLILENIFLTLPLEDPEVAEAATKIQSVFKGHKARREVEEMKGKKEDETDKPGDSCQVNEIPVKEDIIDIDLEDPEVEKAASRIQAGFKGHKARKEVKELKQTRENEEEKVVVSNDKLVNETPLKEDIIDIDLEDPEVEKAASRIQAGFKGHKARKEVEELKQTKKNDEEKAEVSKDKLPKETPPKEDIIDIDLEDPEVEKAASRIQAGFKGHKARKEVEELKQKRENDEEKREGSENGALEKRLEDNDQDSVRENTKEEIVDIDLQDPEVEKAATKIQAGFKGHKTRKDMASLRGTNQNENTSHDVGKKEVTEENTLEAGDKESGGKNEDQEDQIDIDLNDPEVEKAATKIQAGFKGHKTRKEMKKSDDEKANKVDEVFPELDLDDAELSNAATKIQAGFKGMRQYSSILKGIFNENLSGLTIPFQYRDFFCKNLLNESLCIIVAEE